MQIAVAETARHWDHFESETKRRPSTATNTNFPRKITSRFEPPFALGAGTVLTLLREARRGGGVGVVRRNGFDQASDGEGVADASGAANEMNRAALPRELNGAATQ